MSLRISELLAALSHALDLTEGQPVGHAERTCLIALRRGRRDRARRRRPARAGDGVAAEGRRLLVVAPPACASLFGTDDITLKAQRQAGRLAATGRRRPLHRAPRRGRRRASRAPGAPRAVLRELSDAGSEIVEARCDRGASIVRDAGLSRRRPRGRGATSSTSTGTARATRDGLDGDAIAPLARIVALAQSVDVFNAVRGRAAAREMVRERSGRWFEPEVADAFLGSRRRPAVGRPAARRASPRLVRDLDPPSSTALADEAGPRPRVRGVRRRDRREVAVHRRATRAASRPTRC